MFTFRPFTFLLTSIYSLGEERKQELNSFHLRTLVNIAATFDKLFSLKNTDYLGHVGTLMSMRYLVF